MQAKTDNHAPHAKLDLRRYMLDKYPEPDGFDVFDACQGSGFLWRTLRNEYAIKSYWGVDKKKRGGRLMIDSVKILGQPGLTANVIDIDTYGEPWEQWLALLPNVARRTTVFLTVGFSQMGGGNISNRMRTALNIPPSTPITLAAKTRGMGVRYLMTQVVQHGILIVEAVEVVSTHLTRYLGLRLEPNQ